MNIDLGDEVVFNVVHNGAEYQLREPLLKEVKEFQKQANDDNDDGDAFVDFVVKLGMPREVAENLGVIKLRKLADGLTGAITEKK